MSLSTTKIKDNLNKIIDKRSLDDETKAKCHASINKLTDAQSQKMNKLDNDSILELNEQNATLDDLINKTFLS